MKNGFALITLTSGAPLLRDITHLNLSLCLPIYMISGPLLLLRPLLLLLLHLAVLLPALVPNAIGGDDTVAALTVNQNRIVLRSSESLVRLTCPLANTQQDHDAHPAKVRHEPELEKEGERHDGASRCDGGDGDTPVNYQPSKIAPVGLEPAWPVLSSAQVHDASVTGTMSANDSRTPLSHCTTNDQNQTCSPRTGSAVVFS